MGDDLVINVADLLEWINRPPSNDDLDLAKFISFRLAKFYEFEKEIERLNNIIKEQGLEDKPNYYVKGLEGSLKEYQQEIERLNNIINELEKYVNEEYIYDELGMKIFDASVLQDKLQELKGSDK